MLHWKLLGCAHHDRLWFWRFTLPPENKCWRYLELLRDYRLQGKHRSDMLRIVGFHSHSFDLSAGALANVEGGCDFIFLSRWLFSVMRLCGCEINRSGN